MLEAKKEVVREEDDEEEEEEKVVQAEEEEESHGRSSSSSSRAGTRRVVTRSQTAESSSIDFTVLESPNKKLKTAKEGTPPGKKEETSRRMPRTLTPKLTEPRMTPPQLTPKKSVDSEELSFESPHHRRKTKTSTPRFAGSPHSTSTPSSSSQSPHSGRVASFGTTDV
jgi:hypothetical protein